MTVTLPEPATRVPGLAAFDPAFRRDSGGRFRPLFTVSWDTPQGRVVREGLAMPGVETLGRVLDRVHARGRAWGIQVTDAKGADVTLDFFGEEASDRG